MGENPIILLFATYILFLYMIMKARAVLIHGCQYNRTVKAIYHTLYFIAIINHTLQMSKYIQLRQG